MSSRDGSQPPGGRPSLGGRKGPLRPHPKFRADTNYGRLTGKLMNYGDIERDNEGFEAFEKYLNDDVFVSPPPVVSKPPAKVKAKAPPMNTRLAFEEDRYAFDEDDDSPERPFLNISRASTSKAVEPPSRRLAELSTIDYDRIPAPKAPQPRQNPQVTTAPLSRRRPGSSIPTTTRVVNSPKGKGRAVSVSYATRKDTNESTDEDEDTPARRKSKQRPVSPPSSPRVQEEDEGMLGDDGDQPMGGDSDSDPEPFVDNDVPDIPLSQSSSPAAGAKRDDHRSAQYEEEDVPMAEPASDEERIDPGGGDNEEEEAVEDHRVSKKARKEKEKEQKAKAKEAEKKKRQATSSKAKENKVVRTQVQRGDDDDNEDSGVRRGSRQRFAPLAWWRGERAVFRKPRRNDAPVPIIDTILRIPVDEIRPLGARKRKRGVTKPASSRGGAQKRKAVETVDAYVNNPEEGWDDETEENGAVLDYETKGEIQKRIAFTAGMVQPLQPPDAEFTFQKIFSDGEFIAGGVLNIPVKGRKSPRGSRDNTYLFYCVEGAVRVMVHRTSFIISTNGMFMVPRGNQYFIENICEREAKLFFAQARKVSDRLGLSPSKIASVRASLQPRPASQTPQTIMGSPSKRGDTDVRDSPMASSSPVKKSKPATTAVRSSKKAR